MMLTDALEVGQLEKIESRDDPTNSNETHCTSQQYLYVVQAKPIRGLQRC